MKQRWKQPQNAFDILSFKIYILGYEGLEKNI